MKQGLRLMVSLAVVVPPAPESEAPYPPTVGLESIAALIAQAPKTHPRLLATAKDFAVLRQMVSKSTAHRALAEGVIAEARALLTLAPVTRELEGRRLLGQSRRVLKRTTTLGMAYHLTGDEAFARRCEEEMVAVAAFQDWNPSHYLDVAEMTLAMAIGYDWLYDQLDPAKRVLIRDAILDKGVRLPVENDRYAGPMQASNNWGQVCSAGMVAGALATYEDEPKLAATLVHLGIHAVPHSMKAFAPNGCYPEGPGYWGYGTSFNVVLLAELESVFGTSFGLTGAPGFAETGAFPALACGPSGEFFNYADGGSGRGPQEALWWLAQRFDRPDYLLGERAILARQVDRMKTASSAGGSSGRLLPLALLWMDNDDEPTNIRMPLHWNSGGPVPITIHRSSWTDPNASYIGLKAGSPSAPHGQMDTGSFVLDADGKRWALDLGAEGYNGIESRGMSLWSSAQGSDRWTIFRQANAGHNTLVIDGQLQVAKGTAKVVRFSDDPAAPHSVIDLSAVYGGQAKRVLRGVARMPSGELLIQDQLEGLKPGAKVRWGFLTRGSCPPPAAAAVTLTQDDATMRVTRLSPDEAPWTVIDTEKPRNEWDSPNRGTRMLAFEAAAPDSGELTLAVLFTPGSCTTSAAGPIKLRSPLEW
ncbi:MAG: heparinase [Armatimonadetes bacterium CG_4_10_14_3_um_filter_66_18]|nr:heparinase [Armatimonadota bacterium]PIU90132.1 MAG: heparinase [Armatimonadetes bacterium CG06_land_8_20_14_3_00_66_21]PIX49845.1 MAG: heparinase [Armatimonadetes bacterium CG_4_8_14_3_um_filter_66_20]PIY45938.1 MAG: heparinase [Armatimonadetes bacterium CG_4_10_14_3_um_filter_66_18]PIZ46255.1 MAG: heparinase [Armatimonadetes bacterium CG_4_10_14_0_8_um_filter_66_14]PJB70766.1 MAG: heparinase [Armatimonadetes bacterium CG_4_9_14_3_um_filter_66_14]